jgi:RsiW-degrading membrane proteinase PrsW (M82 family)/CRP-like cAMP-binding protein
MQPELAFIIAAIVALVVPLISLYIIRTLDLFGTTRLSTLIVCVIWGAVGAFGGAYLINNATLTLLTSAADLTRPEALRWITGLSAPIIEEILKAALLWYLIRRPDFRYFVDGAIYGFCVGIGFAMVENLFYISSSGSAALTLAASRSLSTSLMHAMASALVGISLGVLRRAPRNRVAVLPLIGIGIAILIHIAYNNIVNIIESQVLLLLIAVSIGLGGAGLIGLFIDRGLKQEKRTFDESLGLALDVSSGERMAIQRLGGAGFETVLEQLRQRIGDENIALIRRMMILQANIGILRNNLNAGSVSPRLRQAWEAEIAEKQAEIQHIRKELGRAVMGYMQTLFPTEDEAMWRWMQDEMGSTDPTMVHTFDMFMRQSGLSANMTPEQLEALADRLHQIEIFKNVSLADLENLGRAVETVTFEPGEMLFDQGDEGSAMYLIVEGGITIYSVDGGQEKKLRTFGPGAVVGDFAVLDGQPRSARARAEGRLTALVLQRQMFKMFIQSRPQVILAVLQVLAEKARYTTRVVENSLQRISACAHGNYDQVVAEMPLATGQMRAAPPQAAPQPDAQQPADAPAATELTGDVHVGLDQAFTRLARALRGSQEAPAGR